MIYHISLHHRTLRTHSLSNQSLQWFQVPLHPPHWPCVYKSTHFNLLNLVYEVVFLCIENVKGGYFCISCICQGISLLQYFISSLWISLDDNHPQMMQASHIFQQKGIYYGTSKTHVNKFYNKLNKHFAHKLLPTSCIFQYHI